MTGFLIRDYNSTFLQIMYPSYSPLDHVVFSEVLNESLIVPPVVYY